MLKHIEWTERARADVRRLDRQTALRMLQALTSFRLTETGDVQQLAGTDPPEYRLRVGDYRIRFRDVDNNLYILRVLHRREAYRH